MSNKNTKTSNQTNKYSAVNALIIIINTDCNLKFQSL